MSEVGLFGSVTEVGTSEIVPTIVPVAIGLSVPGATVGVVSVST